MKPHPDAERARELVAGLRDLARNIEKRTPLARELRSGWIHQVRTLWATYQGLNETRKDGTKLRDAFLDYVRSEAKSGIAARRSVFPKLPDDEQERTAARNAVQAFAAAAPQMAERAAKHLELVNALARAHNRNRGGQGNRVLPEQTVAGAEEALCKAMGWAANADTIKRTSKRHKAKVRTTRK